MKSVWESIGALELARAACEDAAIEMKSKLSKWKVNVCGSVSGFLSSGDVKGGLDHRHRMACLKSAIQGGFVGLAYVEVSLEGFRKPPAEALDVIFEDAVVSGMLYCSTARAMAGVSSICNFYDHPHWYICYARGCHCASGIEELAVAEDRGYTERVVHRSADTGHVSSPVFATRFRHLYGHSLTCSSAVESQHAHRYLRRQWHRVVGV